MKAFQFALIRISYPHLGYLKRFRILSSVYRGRLQTHSHFLRRAAKIIICLSVLRSQFKPMRTHAKLQDTVGPLHKVGNLRIKSMLFVLMRLHALSFA